MLEKTIGEAPGRGTDVETHHAGGIDAESLKRAFELESPSPDVSFRSTNRHRRFFGNPGTWFVNDLLPDADVARHDRTLRFLAAFEQTARYQKQIQTLFRRH